MSDYRVRDLYRDLPSVGGTERDRWNYPLVAEIDDMETRNERPVFFIEYDDERGVAILRTTR